MASDLVVPVVRLMNLREHPNAALLCLADVLGYQMVLPLVEDSNGYIVRRFVKDTRDERGKRVAYNPHGEQLKVETEDVHFRFPYEEGALAVYFPADVLIPAEWADKFGVRQLLKGVDKDRVGRIKLRGEPSFGLVVDIPAGMDWKEGDNVYEYYGAKKYVPPIKPSCGDAAAYDSEIDPYFQKFTDVQNGRIFMEVFKEGEEVVITEKIHGTNCRVGIIVGNLVGGSMETRRKRPCKEDGTQAELDSDEVKKNPYWFPFSIKGVLPLLTDMNPAYDHHDSQNLMAILCGETYGGSVQSLAYGIPKGKGLGFRAFGLRVNGRFLDWDDFKALCDKYGIETVPVLWRGPFSMAKVKEMADGKSTMADHMREGCVIYPVRERTDPKIGRAILKYIGTEYELSKHKDADTKDV